MRHAASLQDGEAFVRFTTEDDLPAHGIYTICQTSDGAIWFGTGQGAFRFDGVTFTNFTMKDGLSHNKVNAVYQSTDGAIWFGTDYGVSRFDGGAFTSFTMENGLVGNIVNDICQSSDGTVWFGTTSGLSAYNGKGFVNFTTQDGLVNDNIWSLYYGKDDVLWIGTGDGVSRFDTQGMVNFTAEDGLLRKEGTLAGVFDIHLTSDKEMWVGTEWGGVLKFDGEKFQRMMPDSGGSGKQKSRRYVRKICQPPDGMLWFGADNGLIRYDNERFEQILSRLWTLTIQDDATGAIWFGNGWRGGGVKKYEPDTGVVTTFTVSDGLSNDSVWAIEKDADDVIWIGTGEGLCRYDGKAFTHETKGWDTPPTVRAIHLYCRNCLYRRNCLNLCGLRMASHGYPF